MLGIPLAVALALAPTPLTAAPLAAAPADVTVAWTSPAHQDVVVTWTETGDSRNRIALVGRDGSPLGPEPKFVEAGEPNRSAFPGPSPGNDGKIVVTAVDADGNPLSEPGSSPLFDMNIPPKPVIKSVVPHEDGTIDMTWAPGTATDDTPDDPLDYETRFIPIAADPSFNQYIPLAPASDRTSFTIPAGNGTPTAAGARTEQDLWGFTGAAVVVSGSKLTASIPATATTGTTLRVTGTAIQLDRACDPGPCWSFEDPDPGRVVTLQSRPDATAPWTTVTTTKATATGAFTFAVTFPGTRDYRVIATPISFPSRFFAGAYAETPATTTRAVAPNPQGGTGGSDDTPGLPITGAPTAKIAMAGAALLLLGIAFTATARKRRRPPPAPDR